MADNTIPTYFTAAYGAWEVESRTFTLSEHRPRPIVEGKNRTILVDPEVFIYANGIVEVKRSKELQANQCTFLISNNITIKLDA